MLGQGLKVADTCPSLDFAHVKGQEAAKRAVEGVSRLRRTGKVAAR